MSEKFTKGEWKVVNVPNTSLQVQMDNGTPVCHMRWSDGMNKLREETILADAHLIAAAPNMFEALDLIMSAYGHLFPVERAKEFVSILNKARGITEDSEGIRCPGEGEG